MTPGTTTPEGSPQLDEKLRSKERAALDIAVRTLRQLEEWNRNIAETSSRFCRAANHADVAARALRRIADLVPEANPGEPQ